MSREVRRVPKDWIHPKSDNGHDIPLLMGYAKDVEKWDIANGKWNDGYRNDYHGGWKPLDGDEECDSYAEWNGDRPDKDDYMPDFTEGEATHYQMYETVSEGTPISPVMGSPEALAKWLVDNNANAFAGQHASYEAWLRIAKGGYACTAVMEGGVVKSGVEAFNDEAKIREV